jgi:hypothetical protein
LIPNQGQGDIDKDGFGDVCDETDVEGALVLGNSKVASAFDSAGRGKGKIVLRGVLFDHPPFDGFVTGLVEGFDPNSDSPDEALILIRVVDDAVLQESVVFTRSECDVKFKRGLLMRAKCRSADKNGKVKFKKHPLGRNVIRFVMKLKKLKIQPLLMERVTVIMTTGAFDRPDQIGDLLPCDVKVKGDETPKTKCREPTTGL